MISGGAVFHRNTKTRELQLVGGSLTRRKKQKEYHQQQERVKCSRQEESIATVQGLENLVGSCSGDGERGPNPGGPLE